MTRLTEGMVIGRTRATDLSSVRKLNCWGSELSDVSLVRQLKFVEVLSLSVNKITTLVDFAYCPNLQELYVRKNDVRDLSEILYLKDLPKLRNFWLEDNPCAVGDRYRLTVLKYLPNLKKLDNIVVQPDELRDAERYGLDLESPTEKQPQPFGVQSPTCETVSSTTGQNSTPSPPRTARHLPPIERDNEFDSEGNIRQNYGMGSPDDHSPERKATAVSTPLNAEGEFMRIPPREMNHTGDYSPTEEQLASKMNRRSRHETFMKSNSVEKDMGLMSPAVEIYEQKPPTMFSDHRVQQLPPIPNTNSREYHEVMHQQHVISIQTPTNPHPTTQIVHSDVYGDIPEDHDPRFREEMYRYSTQIQQQQAPAPIMHAQLQGLHKHHLHGQLLEKILDSPSKPYPTRPKNRNSNILSAVLCLIKELDCASLEVVEMAVRCRMEEIDD